VKLRVWLGYLLGNLFLKGIDPKRSQSKGITDLGPLGRELEQLKKTTKSRPIQGGSWGKVTSQRGTRSSYVTPKKNPTRNRPQNSATKITTKSSENHQKDGWERQHKSLRNHAESSIHTMKVHTRSSLPPIHPSLSL
jgi:predicted component of type VI protein secretion system